MKNFRDQNQPWSNGCARPLSRLPVKRKEEWLVTWANIYNLNTNMYLFIAL